jgi:hypothetical protein
VRREEELTPMLKNPVRKSIESSFSNNFSMRNQPFVAREG